MGKYMDSNGLSHLINKIKTALSGKSDTGHSHAADDVTTGTFADDRIPSLAISKITNLQTTLDGKQPAGDYWSGSKGGTAYWGLVNPEGASTGWTRTTADGLIPAASGENSSSLGTSSWPFKNLYATNIYHNGTKLGTAATSASTDFAAASHNHAAGNITSGTLAVARGGTGTATAAVNKVFAGPSSGTDAAAPSFRSLVAADIPNLNASKITAGTLAVARGGTATATAAANKVFAGPSSGDAAAPSFRSLVAADIPSLNTSKLTAGTLGLARGGTNKSNTDVTYYGGKSLFSGTATNGTVTLSETAANYTWLLIQYRDNESHYSSKIIYSPNSKIVVLDMVYGVSGVGNLKSRAVTISGTSITTVSGSAMDAAHNGGAGTTNHIYITNVWGWK